MTHGTSPEREYLDSLAFFGIKLGLDNIRALLEREGNPHLKLRCVHIAGTNGKGSVSAFLDSIAHTAGYHTGRFTSPHLLDVTERFLIDRAPIEDGTLERHIGTYRRHAEDLRITPTYFELCTAIAFSAFAEAKVDLAIIETGMGGRLDSTNVVEPAVTCITTIGWDHMEHLGDTLAKIAGEKAGIIKPGVPLVMGGMEPEAREVIVERFNEAQHHRGKVPLWELGGNLEVKVEGTAWQPVASITSHGEQLERVTLPLPGFHQCDNAALATAMAMQLRGELPNITPAAITVGLRQARWPCRLERVHDAPAIIIDAAHNPAGMEAYATLFDEAVVVFACSADKDWRAMIPHLGRFANPLICTQYEGTRAQSASSLATAAGTNAIVMEGLHEALEQGLSIARADRPLLITGSIFLAGQARACLQQRGLASPLRF